MKEGGNLPKGSLEQRPASVIEVVGQWLCQVRVGAGSSYTLLLMRLSTYRLVVELDLTGKRA